MTPVSDSPEHEASRSGLARTLGVIGEVIVTLGVVCILFAGYQLWWTNIASASETAAARQQAEAFFGGNEAWAGPTPPIGAPFALMYIPRLRDDVWATPVIQGVERAELAKGVGHYPQTAMPGQVGNFAVAGHRATNGEPFRNFEQLEPGDRIYIRTKGFWFTYELERDQIVTPADVWTINPQPLPANPLSSDKLITLTTCHPRWTSTQRWIFWGVETAVAPASAVPAEVR